MSSHPRHRAATSSLNDAAPPGERVGHGERGVGTAARMGGAARSHRFAVDLQGTTNRSGKPTCSTGWIYRSHAE